VGLRSGQQHHQLFATHLKRLLLAKTNRTLPNLEHLILQKVNNRRELKIMNLLRRNRLKGAPHPPNLLIGKVNVVVIVAGCHGADEG